MCGPRCVVRWGFVDNGAAAGQSERRDVEVKGAIEVGPCRELGVEAGRSEEIEGDVGLREKAAPQVHGEVGIEQRHTHNEVALEGVDVLLCRKGPVIVQRCKLKSCGPADESLKGEGDSLSQV